MRLRSVLEAPYSGSHGIKRSKFENKYWRQISFMWQSAEAGETGTDLGLVSRRDFSELLNTEAHPGVVVPGPGEIQAGAQWNGHST